MRWGEARRSEGRRGVEKKAREEVDSEGARVTRKSTMSTKRGARGLPPQSWQLKGERRGEAKKRWKIQEQNTFARGGAELRECKAERSKYNRRLYFVVTLPRLNSILADRGWFLSLVFHSSREAERSCWKQQRLYTLDTLKGREKKWFLLSSIRVSFSFVSFFVSLFPSFYFLILLFFFPPLQFSSPT